MFHIRPSLEEQAHRRPLAIARRTMQRSVPCMCDVIDVCTSIQQTLHHLQMTHVSGLYVGRIWGRIWSVYGVYIRRVFRGVLGVLGVYMMYIYVYWENISVYVRL